MIKRALALVLLGAAMPASAAAQNVEMVFTPGAADQAMALKSALKVDTANVVWFGALAMVGATPERKKAYADKVKGMTAVVILGEDALKAVSEIEFRVPIIVVNATGRTAAKNRVLRVFDTNSPAAPATAAPASPSAVPAILAANRDVALTGEVGPIVQACLVALK